MGDDEMTYLIDYNFFY